MTFLALTMFTLDYEMVDLLLKHSADARALEVFGRVALTYTFGPLILQLCVLCAAFHKLRRWFAFLLKRGVDMIDPHKRIDREGGKNCWEHGGFELRVLIVMLVSRGLSPRRLSHVYLRQYRRSPHHCRTVVDGMIRLRHCSRALGSQAWRTKNPGKAVCWAGLYRANADLTSRAGCAVCGVENN